MMQRHSEILSDWLGKGRIANNADKSEAICFAHNSTSVYQTFSLKRRYIYWAELAIYLMVLFNYHLNFKNRATYTLKMTRNLRAKLFLMPSWNDCLAVAPRYYYVCCSCNSNHIHGVCLVGSSVGHHHTWLAAFQTIRSGSFRRPVVCQI